MLFDWTLKLIVLLPYFFGFQCDSHEYDKLVGDQKNVQQKYGSSRNAHRDSLKISYIGNMGVLISCDNHQVLIDALHKKYKPDYVFPSKGTIQKLINGNYNKNLSIDIALVTHYHKDHFDAGLVNEYLRKNVKSIVLCPPQVKEAIKANSQEIKLSNRIKEIPYDEEMHTITHDEIKVKAFKSPHVNTIRHGSVQNIAFIVKIKSYSILHVGDTNWDTAKTSFKNQNLIDEKFDAIVLPYWMLLDKSFQNEILETITTKQIIATHIPPSLSEIEKRTLLSNHSRIILLTVQGEEVAL